jgi:fatty acid desaturase
MADLVVRDGIGFKRRNPWGVFLLSLITFGIYYIVWWYKINNELKNFGVKNSPTVATLAITIGGLIIVPPLVSLYRTADRIKTAQESAGSQERMVPVLGLVLAILTGIFHTPYYQSQINKVWDALAEQGAEVTPA